MKISLSTYPAHFRRLLWKTIGKWQSHNINWLAAALAYYALFSLAPTFLLIVITGGFFFGEDAVTGEIVRQLQSLIGYESAYAIQEMVEASRTADSGLPAKWLSLAVVLLSATSVFSNLVNTMDIIWESGNDNRHWVTSILLDRLFSVLLVVGVGILILALVLVDVGLAGFGKVLAAYLPVFTQVFLWRVGSLVVAFFILIVLFSALYKLLPEREIGWRDVWPGALLSALLFSLGKILIANFLASGRTVTLFGAASSFIAILVWVYYSAQIFLFGAAFSFCYASTYGSLKKTEQERFKGGRRQNLKKKLQPRRRK